jgi:hypothetical protein
MCRVWSVAAVPHLAGAQQRVLIEVMRPRPMVVHVGRIRQTVIEHRRQPVAHTRQTMNDHYLRRSRAVEHDSRTVVGATLRTGG